MGKTLSYFASVALGTVLVSLTAVQAQSPVSAHAALSTEVAAPNPAEPAYAEAVANDPVADPKATVIVGNARFTVLTSELIRMEWSADGKFEDRASLVFVNRRLPVPRFHREFSQDKSKVVISTNALTLSYNSAASPQGRFTPEALTINLSAGNKLVVWRPGMVDDQNLQGTTRTLDGAVGGKTREPIEPGLISRSGWALVDDSVRPLFDSADFSFKDGENSPWPWVVTRPAGDRQDWYFFAYGHDYKHALGDYVRIAGRIPLPPHFAFGAWWSRYWAFTDQEIEQIIRGMRESDVPYDVFVIDMDWHPTFNEQFGAMDASNHRRGWTGYTWNKLYFPDPDQFLARLHAAGLKTSLNLHPASGIQPWEERYPQMARAMGIDPSSKQYIPFDITNKKFAENYFNVIHHPLEKQGIDFWWLDWQQEPTTKTPGVNPTWWLNYVHFTDQQREGKRPLLFHRWGGLGNHRYQIGFSGDTVSVWDSLAFQPWFTATAANVGYAYWSHDIGGHAPGAVDPELFTRWVQFGAFSPILRTHTTKNPDAERRIWAYPEPYSSILRDTFQLRYALQPYIYTEARRTYDTGVAFFRPLYYDWPSNDHSYTAKNEYQFGAQMIVAPVVAPGDSISGLATEDVWLPAGGWIEWPSGKHLAGNNSYTRSFSIDQTPVYLKDGAIVPMQPPMHYTGEKPVDPLILSIWPLAEHTTSTYSVYEDSGKSVEYQNGVFATTPVKATQSGDTLKVEIGPVAGSYPGMLRERSYQLCLPTDWPPESIRVNGVEVKRAGALGNDGWSYQGNTLTTVIPVPAAKVESRVLIEVRRAEGRIRRRDALDGFPGTMTRLRGSYEAMHNTWPIAKMPDPLLDAMQTGNRIGYHPENIEQELAHLKEVLPQAQAALDELASSFPQKLEAYVDAHNKNSNSPDADAQKQRRLNALKRAQKLFAEASSK